MLMRVMGLCLSLVIIGGLSTRAQEVRVHSGFLVDSLGIGDEGGYFLTARLSERAEYSVPRLYLQLCSF